MDEIESLKSFGLTEGEAKVYLALLVGMSTKSEIIRKSGVSSSIVYDILERLIKKGLVSFVFKDKKKYFFASEPEALLELLKQEEEKIKEIKKTAKNLISLLEKRKVEKTLFASVYEGMNGLKVMLNEIKFGRQWLAMGVSAYKKESFNRFWVYWHNKVRPKHRIKAKFIFSEKDSDYFKTLRKTPLSEVSYIPSQTPACITITGENVLIMKYTEPPSFILLNNKDVAKTFEEVFKALWKNATRL